MLSKQSASISIKICALRITTLNALGDVGPGPNNYAATQRETKLGCTADTDKGKDLSTATAATSRSRPIRARTC